MQTRLVIGVQRERERVTEKALEGRRGVRNLAGELLQGARGGWVEKWKKIPLKFSVNREAKSS